MTTSEINVAKQLSFIQIIYKRWLFKIIWINTEEWLFGILGTLWLDCDLPRDDTLEYLY